MTASRSGHWYEGGGIKRNVYIERVPARAHIVTDGVFVSPERGSDGIITASAEIESFSPALVQNQQEQVTVTFRLETVGGTVIATNSTPAVLARAAHDTRDTSTSTATPVTTVARVTLDPAAMSGGGDGGGGGGSPVTPWHAFTFSNNQTVNSTAALYRMVVSVAASIPALPAAATSTVARLNTAAPAAAALTTRAMASNELVDQVNVTCGFRQTEWRQKFYLNGNETQLRGFSHHDSFAGVGVAMAPRIHLFQAQANRALGGNFWRMSHNPYDDVLYSILDALGVLVWDEVSRKVCSRPEAPITPMGMHDQVLHTSVCCTLHAAHHPDAQ